MLGHQNKLDTTARVGLDIGHHTVNGVEVVERASEIVIRSAGSAAIPGLRSKQDLPEPSAVAHAIKSLWSSARFASRKVVLALPPTAVYMKWLHLEAADEEELEQTASAAASRGAPFPAGDAITDYRILSWRCAGSRKVYFTLLVAASASIMEDMLNTVESAGLEPVAVDIGVAAAVRSASSRTQASGILWSGQPKAHCIMGAKNTTIAVIRENALEFARTVPVGGNDFTERIAEHAGLSWAEAEKIKMAPGVRLNGECAMVASGGSGEIRVPCEQVVGRLAREIQRSLKFFKSQYAEGSYLGMIGGTTASGGGALLKGLDSCLQDHGIEINGIVNPFAGFSVAAESGGVQDVGDNAAAYTTAVGLATADYWHAARDEDLEAVA
ncbi:MAG: type IV pilus assembly protein PilM [Armatimonadota bacterium]|nr:type IV pilus assembly protein PilM [bacterium]